MFVAFVVGLERVIGGAYTKRRWMLHVLAALMTAVVVLSGFDWAYFLATRSVRMIGLPAAILGFFVPIVTPVALYAIGEFKKQQWLQLTSAALGQAGLAGLLISSFYKIFTGRVQPEFYTFSSTLDNSREFLFGFFRHGVFWGWPSSHASVAVSMGVALILLFPRSHIVRYSSLLYMAYVVFGVSVSIHWLSDALAGICVGIAVGISVAERYRGRIEALAAEYGGTT